jgi:hypothetical protein
VQSPRAFKFFATRVAPESRIPGNFDVGSQAEEAKMASWSAAHLLFALAALAPAPTDAFVSSTSLSHLAPRGLASPGLLSLKAKTFQPNELGVNINGPPNAQGSFGRVYFGKQVESTWRHTQKSCR